MELNELIRRAQTGDCEAFAAVFEQYRPLLYAIGCRMVGVDDADDAVMETYLKAWRSLPNFRGEAALKTWLVRVFRSCATDLLRKRGRREARTTTAWPEGEDERESWIETLADERGPTPARQAELDDLGDHLHQALHELSAEHRATLLLREVDGLSYGDIAKATGVGMGTVMSRLFYAKRRLRQLLSKKGIAQ